MRTPPPPEMTFGFLIQLVFCEKKKKTMMFIGVEVEKETSVPPPKTILDPPLIYIYIYIYKTSHFSVFKMAQVEV